MSANPPQKLSLFGAIGIAVGGMMGGGIFAVMGEVVAASGNAGFISLGIGGILALITGMIYSKLTVKFNEQGGCFTFLEHFSGPQLAGTASWFLIVGYIYTITLYGYIFGAYAERLLNLGYGPNFYLGSGIIIFITIINLISFRDSGASKSLLITFKAVIILGLIVVGFITVKTHHILPIVSKGPNSIIFGSALGFVAYEGFQLLTYDYNTIYNHKINLPKAVTYSIGIVIVIYMLIGFVVSGNLSAEVISKNKETVIALIAYPLFGRPGIIVVMVAAIFSTASAILASIFAVARLAQRVSKDRQLPHQITEWQSGNVPVIFTILIALFSVVIQYYSSIHQITLIASLIFLIVFSVVNFMGYRYKILDGWKIILPIVGGIGCAGAAVVLLYGTFQNSHKDFYAILGIFAAVLIARFSFTWFHSRYKGRPK